MPKNEFKAFAIGKNANVLTQAEFDELSAVINGFQSGIARSEQLNKVWRQSSVISHVVAEFMAENSGDDILDDGNLDKLKVSLVSALFNNAKAQLDERYLNIIKNLSDLSNKAEARRNLDIYSRGEVNETFLQKEQNGADIPDKPRFVDNLDLRETVNLAVGALQKNQNGADISNKSLFAHNINVFTQTESDARYLKTADNLPVGIPLPWPLATPPTGWIICNGQAFDKAHCPQLALAYPSGVLPDLRGLFIRGWDNGRNLDGGRTLLSFQGDAIRNITGFYIQNLAGNSYWNGCGGAFYQEGNAFGHHANNSGGNGATTKRFDASRVVPTANENRPVNMAFNYIVRAA
ncbi:putative bacteriophage tail fiber protein [Yersinia enterocolitica]|uniref:phage tail protein n=1 Tax=Yersinia enterocolitica TaxID=630 RepID=UPI0005E2CE58|nr:phage tail protein [Yersinia enterocolitica]CNK98050.1 putative bacteriophage tail fiber protein [Yersinia enterocolitica]